MKQEIIIEGQTTVYKRPLLFYQIMRHLLQLAAHNNGYIRCLFCWFGYLIFPTKFVVCRKLVGSEAGTQYIRRR